MVEFAKPAAAKKETEPEIREQDLDGHMQGAQESKPAPETKPAVPETKPAAPPKPAHPTLLPKVNGAGKEPSEQELLQKDNQLARALELIKGVNVLKKGLLR